MGLILLLASCAPSGRISISVPSLCDNTGAEAIGNKLFTSKQPTATFAQCMCLLIWHTGIQVDVQHVTGSKNVDADYLSRWQGDESKLDAKWCLEHRMRISLPMLLQFQRDVHLWPPAFRLKWHLPQTNVLSRFIKPNT